MSFEMDRANLLPKNWKLKFQKFPTLIPTVLCYAFWEILAVLLGMTWTAPDFLTFVAPAVEGIAHLHAIRYAGTIDTSRNLYKLHLSLSDFRTKSSIGWLEII